MGDLCDRGDYKYVKNALFVKHPHQILFDGGFT
jgi:hypothetical protein